MNDNAQETLLVVDDVPANIAILADILGSDYRVTFATSGRDALTAAQAQPPPSLILMDVMMPEFGGLEVVRKIKEYRRLARVPILMMTGNSEKDIVIKSRKVGACGFIVKPFSRDLLLTKVREALRSA